MSSFIARPMVITQTVGERLKKVRLGAGFSVDEASRQTGITRKYLECIEAGQYGELPGEIYCLEFIKTYARFLRIDAEKAAAAYRAEKQHVPQAALAERGRARLLRSKIRSVNPAALFQIFGFAAFLSLVAGLPFAFGRIAQGPKLEVFSPVPYYKIHDSQVVLSGKADPGSVVALNNQRIPVGADGVFEAEFNAPPGSTLLQISAFDDHGRSTTEYRTVVVDKGEVAGASTRNNQIPISNNQ